MAMNSYDKQGTLSTSIQPRGMDIGPIPDFWGDINSIIHRLQPVQRQAPGGSVGPSQASALRAAPEAREPVLKSPLQAAQERAAIIAANEQSQPSPLMYRPATPGTTGGWQQDINAMDANQRKMFLPQSSQFSGGGGFDQAGALRDTPGLNSINEAMNQEAVNEVGRRRLAHAGDVGPGGSTGWM